MEQSDPAERSAIPTSEGQPPYGDAIAAALNVADSNPEDGRQSWIRGLNRGMGRK